MGKRKSSKKVAVRRGPAPLDKTFRCILCQHPGTITCKLDRSSRIGTLSCKNCSKSFSTNITHLTQPIDLYSDWIDAAAEVNEVRSKRPRVQDDDEEEEEEESDGGERAAARRKTARSESPDEDDRRRRRAALDESDEDLPEV